MDAISVSNLSKGYMLLKKRRYLFRAFSGCSREGSMDERWALRDVHFDVPKGQTCGLIGRNGSGKSTLLGVVSGIISPSSGSATTTGRIASILELGAGFQAEMTGRQNIVLSAAILGLSKGDALAKMESIIGFSELAGHVDKPLKTFSSGMLLRLGFAVAIHAEFDILIIDELLSVGDLLFKRKCFAKMRQFKDEGKTILLASHNLPDVAAFCDRILLMDEGRIVMDGTVETVLRQYWENCEREQNRIVDRLLFKGNSEIYGKNTRDIELTHVTFLDGQRRETRLFHTEEAMIIRMGYFAHKGVKDPLFRVQFFRNDGLWVHGANTGRQNFRLGIVEGSGEIELVYERLNLLEGDYYVTAGIWPDEYASMISKLSYDLHEMAYVIHIKSNRGDGGGLVYNPFRWRVAGAERDDPTEMADSSIIPQGDSLE